jgi:hypothetical protein
VGARVEGVSMESRLKLCEEAWKVFCKNMELAERFLSMAEAKELRMDMREVRPLARLRDKVGPLRKFLADLYEVGLPLVLVFGVTCYEFCLKRMYEALKGDELTREEELAFLRPDEVRNLYGKYVRKDPLDGADQLAVDVRIAILKRNVIVHRAGEIDKTAEDEFRKVGVSQYKSGQRLELKSEEVKRDLNTLKSYVAKIYDSLISCLKAST